MTAPDPVAALSEALEFYADPDKWDEFGDDCMNAAFDRNFGSTFGRDMGARARAAAKTHLPAVLAEIARLREAVETQAAADVLAERRRQIEIEGWTPEHDDQHTDGAMARAAAVYALNGGRWHDRMPSPIAWWPWSLEWWKPTNRRRDCVIAAALLLAEIERLDRAALARPEPGQEAR